MTTETRRKMTEEEIKADEMAYWERKKTREVREEVEKEKRAAEMAYWKGPEAFEVWMKEGGKGQ